MTTVQETKISLDSRNFDNKTIDDLFPRILADFSHKRHDEPCPKQTTDDIAQCPLVNEWVLNHLPLTEKQKQKLLQQLVVDQLKHDKAKKSQRWKVTSKSTRKQASKDGTQMSIKDLTKLS